MRKSCCLSFLIVWVLWTETMSTTDSYWTPINRYESDRQCQRNLKKKVNSWRSRRNVNVGSNVVLLRKQNVAITYSCLPGNIDPGPRKTE
jgi:hypothetical protein